MSLKDDITDTKKDFHKANVNMKNDRHAELSLIFQVMPQETKAKIGTKQEGKTETNQRQFQTVESSQGLS
jgi:hypothetical protein